MHGVGAGHGRCRARCRVPPVTAGHGSGSGVGWRLTHIPGRGNPISAARPRRCSSCVQTHSGPFTHGSAASS